MKWLLRFLPGFLVFLLTFLITSLTTSLAMAESYYVKPIVSSGLSATDADSVYQLVQAAVSEAGATLANNEGSADAALEPKVMRLGSSFILSVSKVRHGSIVFSQKAHAATIEDMDTVANRVVRAVIKEKRFETDTKVSDVTEDEKTRGMRRKDVVSQWFLGFGPAYSTNLNTTNMGLNLEVGYSWGIDPQAAIRLQADFGNMSQSDALYTNFNLGVDYFLSENNTSPFVQVDFGYGGVTADDQNAILSSDRASGFTVGAGLGVRFFRASRVNLGLTLHEAFLLAKTSKGNPGITTLTLAVYF